MRGTSVLRREAAVVTQNIAACAGAGVGQLLLRLGYRLRQPRNRGSITGSAERFPSVLQRPDSLRSDVARHVMSP